LTEEERVRGVLANAVAAQNISATLKDRDLGQTNYVESAGFSAFEKLPETIESSIRFQRMPDSNTVDYCAIIGSVYAPVQVKVRRGPPGTQVKFNVNKADGAVGGRYEDHILICLNAESVEELSLNANKFDDLPLLGIKEAYIMKSSDINSNFQPLVYDHAPGSKRGRENAYEKFRYVFGHDDPKKLKQLMQSLESNIKAIGAKRGWTRDDCFFAFGSGTPNTNVSETQKTELRGLKAVSDALKPFEPRAALRQNETVDILFWQRSDPDRSVRVSLKTASYHNLNKETKKFSGFRFNLSKAPNAHHCDIVIAISFDLTDSTQVVTTSVFDANNVYNTGLKTFCWKKSAHQDTTFDMTSEVGRKAFKEHVALFMKSDDQRITNVNK
jgi:hypothetical protein